VVALVVSTFVTLVVTVVTFVVVSRLSGSSIETERQSTTHD
jgi:VIT1/CCC1 family predicted Fe2+/Mn2+ transporter